ncbi:LysR family transcriptional regulator [Enterovibrio norvegicus]|uniref:LysR family transcriptional regulator n=1 Tax=Enterovibrio norvegicus TaxID=188144 RepID=UPI0035541B10
MEPVLDLDLLRTFVAVAEAGEIKGAAEKVHRSSGAVSMQMKRLQEVVGCELLARNHRGMVLTEDGQLLLHRSKEMLRLNALTLSSLRGKDVSGQLTFGIPTDYASDFVQHFLPVLQSKCPNLDARIVCDRSRHLRQKLMAGNVDIAIAVKEQGFHDELTLWSEALEWVASPSLKFEADEDVPVAIFDADCLVRDLTFAGLKSGNIHYKQVFSSPVLDNISLSVNAGLAVSLLPESLVDNKTMVRVNLNQAMQPMALSLNLVCAPSVDAAIKETVTHCFLQTFSKIKPE